MTSESDPNIFCANDAIDAVCDVTESAEAMRSLSDALSFASP